MVFLELIFMYVFLSFDFDADSAEMLYYEDKPVKISLARFSVRKGLRRVLNLLDEFDIKTTFFVPGWVAERYPDLIRMILDDYHELAMHGYRHEKLDALEYEKEYDIHRRAKEILSRIQGKVFGFRKPYFEISKNTLNILAELGILYDSSLMDSDEPYILQVGNKEIIELPVYTLLDDWILFEEDHRSPKEVLNMWVYELDSAIEEQLNYFCLILHPACIGRASRIRMLRDFILYAKKKHCTFSKGVEIAKKLKIRKQ